MTAAWCDIYMIQIALRLTYLERMKYRIDIQMMSILADKGFWHWDYGACVL